MSGGQDKYYVSGIRAGLALGSCAELEEQLLIAIGDVYHWVFWIRIKADIFLGKESRDVVTGRSVGDRFEDRCTGIVTMYSCGFDRSDLGFGSFVLFL